MSNELLRVPPQATEVEVEVLGICLLERHAFDMVADILKTECFYTDCHQMIFDAMVTLSRVGNAIDVFTIMDQLKKTGQLDLVGGPSYLNKLTNRVTSSANIENHCRIILEKYMLRELIRIGGQLANEGYQSDVFTLIEKHEKDFTKLTSSNLHSGYKTADNAVVDAINHISDLRKNPGHMTGIPTGFEDLDKITHGWQPTDLIILAARPAVGKTAFSLNLARNACNSGTSVGFFSLEMSTGQLMDRILSTESEVFLERIKSGMIDDNDMNKIMDAGARISKYKLFMDDTGALNIYQLRSRARNMKRKHGIKMIIIDYLQLMSSQNKKGNRESEVSEISRELKALAKELELPIIALSQLSRKTEERKGSDKMPQLSDLRESGAIEQDADMVMFLYRPEYYDEMTDHMGASTAGQTHVKIAKHRNGSLDTIILNANLSIQKFNNGVTERIVSNGAVFRSLSSIEGKKEELPF